MEKVSNYTYRLKLPSSMGRLYNVFHASLLWERPPQQPDLAPISQPDHSSLSSSSNNTPVLPPSGLPHPTLTPEQELQQLEPGEYIIENILARKKHGRGYQYFVKWKGYPD